MRLCDVSLCFGEKTVLDHVSFMVPERKVVALEAPSGRGKTTVLKLFAGLLKPDAGNVEGPERGDFSILFQENRLFPDMNVRDQVACVLPKGGDPMPWLRAVGLEEEAEECAESLSGGMQRRLSLARCLAYGKDKQYLLLDEPFAGVDPQRTVKIMAFIRSMEKTVLLSSHGASTLSLADEIIRF